MTLIRDPLSKKENHRGCYTVAFKFSLKFKVRNTVEQHRDTITNYMYLGLLPFFACALGPWVFPDSENFLSQLFFFYASLILVFLAGALWAIALFAETEFRSRHIHIAIAFSLWPLASYWLPSVRGLGLMLLGFLLLLFWEKCFMNTLYPEWYQKLRHKITFIVVACHMLSIWNLIRV